MFFRENLLIWYRLKRLKPCLLAHLVSFKRTKTLCLKLLALSFTNKYTPKLCKNSPSEELLQKSSPWIWVWKNQISCNMMTSQRGVISWFLCLRRNSSWYSNQFLSHLGVTSSPLDVWGVTDKQSHSSHLVNSPIDTGHRSGESLSCGERDPEAHCEWGTR